MDTPQQPTRRMTKRRALHVLMHHAARDVAGVGQGIRPGATDDEKRDVAAAVRALYPDAYGFVAIERDLLNLGLRHVR